MTLRQVWILECDSPRCPVRITGAMKKQKQAMDMAAKLGWTFKRSAGRYDCYCPVHKYMPPKETA